MQSTRDCETKYQQHCVCVCTRKHWLRQMLRHMPMGCVVVCAITELHKEHELHSVDVACHCLYCRWYRSSAIYSWYSHIQLFCWYVIVHTWVHLHEMTSNNQVMNIRQYFIYSTSCTLTLYESYAFWSGLAEGKAIQTVHLIHYYIGFECTIVADIMLNLFAGFINNSSHFIGSINWFGCCYS